MDLISIISLLGWTFISIVALAIITIYVGDNIND